MRPAAGRLEGRQRETIPSQFLPGPPVPWGWAEPCEGEILLKYTRAAIVTAIAAATVTFGVQLAHSAPAQAASIPTAPCAAEGVTEADKNLAKEISPQLN